MEPFYWSYMIDTSGIDCWKVIYVRCDWVHEYKTVCELFEDCDFTWPAIDWCRMIPWINPNQPGIPNPHAGWILGINGTWTCVQWINPSTLVDCTDELVWASSSDPTPWYLEDKLISSDWTININLISWWTIIDLTANLPSTPTIPNPASACSYGAYLMSVWWVYTLKCDNTALFATRYLSNDTPMAVPANSSWRYWQIVCTEYQWHPSMSIVNAGNPPVTGIKIIESWMYNIWFNSWAYIDQSVGKIRFMLWSTNTWDTPNKKLLLNAKAGVGDSDALPIVDTTRWESHKYITMSENWLVRLNSWDWITMVMRIDWLTLPAGTVLVEWGGLIENDPLGWWDWAPPWTMALKYCWTSFGVARHSAVRHNAL